MNWVTTHSMPKVSVIVPTFNRANFIKESIDSILAQTYTDFEIIVVDDGSTDRTGEVLKGYGDRIRYYHQANQGQPAALNFGISQARGEYIAFNDDDDMWVPDKLGLQLSIIENDPELGFVGTGMYLADESGEITSVWRKDPAIPDTFDSLFEENIIGGTTVLVRKKLINAVGGFDANLRTTHDYDLWLRLAKICKFRSIDTPTVKWRIHNSNKHKNTAQKMEDRVRVITRPENVIRAGFIKTKIRVAKIYYTYAQQFQDKQFFGPAGKAYLKSLLNDPLIGRYYRPQGKVRLFRSLLLYRVLRTYLKSFYCFWRALSLQNRRRKAELVEKWSIGIGKLKLENGRIKLFKDKTLVNPVLTAEEISDRKADYVADPFLVSENGIYYLFFEIFENNKGSIGLAESKDCRRWSYRKVILEEAFHLSYPFLFNWQGKYYMIPESYQTRSVRLYEAVDFPLEWRFSRILLEGKEFTDPTLLYFENKLWLFVSDTTSGNLYLYCADSLEGHWQEHPKNPIIKDNRSMARPGGSILRIDHRLIRIAQDDVKTYGYALRALEINKLTPQEYSEKEVAESPLLKASGRGWNKDGMHHLSVCQMDGQEWFAAFDGKSYKKL